MDIDLTDRQKRERDYHRAFAAKHANLINASIPYDVTTGKRWWNQGWAMFGALARAGVRGKKVLVIGCGFGEDALLLAHMGAEVSGFDISPESLEIGRLRAEKEGVRLHLEEMTAESLSYPDCYFDVVLAHDILHHVNIPSALEELKRVSKPDAKLVVNEVYTHSLLEKLRRAQIVDRFFRARVQAVIYEGEVPYITEDERKLTERDIEQISIAAEINRRSYFNLFVMRILPDRWKLVSQIDYSLLRISKTMGALLAGRILLEGTLSPSNSRPDEI